MLKKDSICKVSIHKLFVLKEGHSCLEKGLAKEEGERLLSPLAHFVLSLAGSVAMRTPRRSYSLLLLLALGMSILLIWSDYSHRAIVESLQSENQQLHSQFQKVDQKLGFLQGRCW